MIKIDKQQHRQPEILFSHRTVEEIKDLLSGKNTKKIYNNRPEPDSYRIEYKINSKIYRHSAVVKSLKNIYHNKCAFCESVLDKMFVITYRPKHKYFWLAYEWSNLIPVCPACSSNKRDKFPIKEKKLEQPLSIPKHKSEWHAENLLSEEPFLLHPEIDRPEEYFTFNPNGEILPNRNIPENFLERAKQTIDICGLNRDTLKYAREKKISDFYISFKNQIITLENFTSKINSDLIKLSFTNIFDSLLKSAQPEAEFSLLGIRMIENFDYFFTQRIESRTGKSILNKAYQIFIRGRFSNDFKENNEHNSTMQQLNIQEDDLLIKQPTKDKYLKKKNIENFNSCAVKQLKIENYNGIVKTEILDIPIDTRWIFLTGENGFGKTSVLQAIVVALNGKYDKKNIPIVTGDNKIDETKPIKIGIEFKNENKNIINNIDSENFKQFNNFCAYGPSRLNLDNKKNKERRETHRTNNIFDTKGLLFDIEIEVDKWKINNNAKIEATKKLLIKLLEPYIDIDIDKNNYDILYSEKDIKTGKVLHPINYDQLASGFRSLIAMIGDMLIRFDRVGQDITQPENLKGFVIIDEFDLHWHPKWQRLLVTRLSDKFKKIQFIVSTHSILPIIGAPKESVFIKVTKNKEKGIIAERIELDLENLSPNIILSSPLFDTPLLSIQNKNEDDFATDDNYEKWKEDNDIDNILNQFIKENSND